MGYAIRVGMIPSLSPVPGLAPKVAPMSYSKLVATFRGIDVWYARADDVYSVRARNCRDDDGTYYTDNREEAITFAKECAKGIPAVLVEYRAKWAAVRAGKRTPVVTSGAPVIFPAAPTIAQRAAAMAASFDLRNV